MCYGLRKKYAFCRYSGDGNLGSSEWSSGVGFVITVAITTASGRIIYRHENNKGSVIEYEHYSGRTRRVFVADAIYRGNAQFGTEGTNVIGNSINACSNASYNIIGTNKYISSTGSSCREKNAIGIVTDAMLRGWFNSGRQPNTGTTIVGWNQDLTMRSLCNTWMTRQGITDGQQVTGVPAVEMCRALTSIFAGGCDLPDIFTLAVVFIEGETIDSIDPTATVVPEKALGETINPHGHGYINGLGCMWSATEYNNVSCLYLAGNGYVNYSMSSNSNINKRADYGVIPCRQI